MTDGPALEANRRANKLKAERTTVSCLSLAADAEVTDALKDQFSSAGITLLPHVSRTLQHALWVLRRAAPAFAVAYMSGPISADTALSPALMIRSVTFPPLVVVTPEPISTDEREFLRLQGAAHILSLPIAEQEIPILESLTRSGTWTSAPLERMPLPDVMQMMGTHRQSGMISVECPHCTALSRTDWQADVPLGCIDGSGDCNGVQGRVYLRDGEVIHLEAPHSQGLIALSHLLRLRSGNVRVHEVFIDPKTRNAEGTVQSNLMNAIVALDEDGRDDTPTANGTPQVQRADEVSNAIDATEEIDLMSIDPSAQSSSSFAVLNEEQPPRAKAEPTTRLRVSSEEANPNEKSQSMGGVEVLLRASPEIRVAAKADGAGNTTEVAGEGDGESMCAVAALCAKPIERAMEMLGLGAPDSWSITTANITLYVKQAPDGNGFVAAVGRSSKTPAQVLTKIHQAAEGIR